MREKCFRHTLDSLLPHLTKNIIGVDDVSNAPLKKLENELYGFVWKTKSLDEKEGTPVGLVGGGNHIAKCSTVKNLQKFGWNIYCQFCVSFV